MSVIPGEVPIPHTDGKLDPSSRSDSAVPTLKSLHLRRLLITLPLALLGFAVFWGAVQGLFVPLQVQRIDAAGQNAALALIVGVGAIASVIGSPIAGALTDRTRSRLGGRTPWMVGGAVATLALALVLSSTASISVIVVCYALAQFTTALILTPAGTYIADRVPASRRGIFSALYGFAQLGGTVVGQAVGASFSTTLQLGYLVVAGALVLVVVLFAIANSRSNIDQPKQPSSVGKLLSTFWVNPVAHPNFAWAFAGRFLLFTGFFPMQIFLLYLLQDYIGLRGEAVGAVPMVSATFGIGALAGTVLAGVLVALIKRVKVVVYLASALIVVGLLVPLVWPSLPAMMIWGVVSGIGVGIYMSVDFMLVTLVLPSAEDAGKDLGIINIANTLPQTLGAVIGAAAVGLFGSFVALIPFAVIATVLGAVAVWRIRSVQ